MIGSSSSMVPGWCGNYTGNMTIYLMPYHCSKVEVNLTSCQLVQSQLDMENIRVLCDVSEAVWYGAFWFSVVVGLIGNTLALVTIASLPVSIATFYVALLAFSDLMAIVMRTVIYFLEKKRLMNPTTLYWHIFPLLFDFSVSYSSWLLVLICFDRFITIRYPLQRRFYFTVRHARLAALTMAVLLFAVYIVALRILGYIDTRMFTVRNLLYSVIPLFFILIFIVLIAIQFRIIHRKRKLLQECAVSNSNRNKSAPSPTKRSRFSLHASFRKPRRSVSTRSSPAVLGGGGGGGGGEYHRAPTHHTQRSNVFEDIERLENNITIMMLVTAICFAILTIPNCVFLFTYRHAIEHWNTPLARARWHVFSKTSNVLTFLNLSINFLLYFLSGSKFRRQLWRLLRCGRTCSLRKKEKESQGRPALLNVPSSSETYL